MILDVNILRGNKILGKGRDKAADLLQTFSQILRVPLPNYAYKPKDLGDASIGATSTIAEQLPSSGNQPKTIINKNGSGKKSSTFAQPPVILCEVSTRIPTPIYQQKLLRDAKQQKKQQKLPKQQQQQILMANIGQQLLQRQQNSTTNGIKNGSNNNNSNTNGINLPLLQTSIFDSIKQAPAVGYDLQNNHTYVHTKADGPILVPTQIPPPTQDKKGESYFIYGAGESANKSTAKNLAALEVIYQIEQIMNVERGQLREHLLSNEDHISKVTESHHNLPYDEPIPGVTWNNIPMDTSFVAFSKKVPRTFVPATRMGNIDFIPNIMNNEHAIIAAKAITLASQNCLPTMDIHSNTMAHGTIQRYANIQASGGPLEGIVGTLPGGELNIGIQPYDAIVLSLIHLYNKMTHEPTQKNMKRATIERYLKMVLSILKEKGTSYGMAKLFVSLPKHQLDDVQQLLLKIPGYRIPSSYTNDNTRSRRRQQRRIQYTNSNNSGTNAVLAVESRHNREHQERIRIFREHQRLHPLPVDSVEVDIPHGNDVSITIVRGGTGSGKTTRYPLMLNLFSPESSHIIVAQPRRLACQTAARRVAQEQGYALGKYNKNCPIGYAIRFETITPSFDCDRTIQFQTPGVLLRQAAEDPLLSDVTHLCIDEIHERNADIDLLLALAKQAVIRRLNHAELPPLKLILMSATLDSSHWESYFRDNNNSSDGSSPNISVAVVNVPETRRYPITTVHLDDNKFPLERYHTQELIGKRSQYDDDFEDDICRVTAQLALQLYQKNMEGSILCFLPGMEEIRKVHRYIDYRHRGQVLPKVIYLHSSVSSSDQALAFEPGAKIILSTNIAETSVTIPDCKFVIDSGRERQFSLLGSSSTTSTTADESQDANSISVVGSQLISVDISQASAKQRAGRAGRVSAGTCYRLYTKNMFEYELPEFTTPEMLRMDLSQLVLHSISLYHPSSGDHPLSLLSGAPDPPTEARLRQTLRGLVSQGLVDIGDNDDALESFTRAGNNATSTKEHPIRLTPLGRAVNGFPVDPRVGRMLFMGMVIRAIDPALTIAALLSVPKVFSPSSAGKDENKGITTCSDIIVQMDEYNKYVNRFSRDHPKSGVFDQVTRIRNQLERAMTGHLQRNSRSTQSDDANGSSEINWNMNSDRVAAQSALICSATPHIAHLVHGKEEFATRDAPGTAKIHPSSVNHRPARRAYWYVYHELRQGKAPYLYTTTAVSPLELALFSDADSLLRDETKEHNGSLYEHIWKSFGDESWMVHADHWIPVVASIPSQKKTILRLRQLLMYEMLQQVAINPASFAGNEKYMQIVLYVLSALEQQRLPPPIERHK